MVHKVFGIFLHRPLDGLPDIHHPRRPVFPKKAFSFSHIRKRVYDFHVRYEQAVKFHLTT